MTHKVTVGLQQKVGQPNFGSIGASCSIEVHLDDDEAVHPEVVTSRVRQAFSQCRDCITKELSLHEVVEPNESSSREREPRPAASRPTTERSRTSDRPQRTATEAQVRAIRAIASKAGVSLVSFGTSKGATYRRFKRDQRTLV